LAPGEQGPNFSNAIPDWSGLRSLSSSANPFSGLLTSSEEILNPGFQSKPFYEAGSCQEEFGFDCFTLLFEFPQAGQQAIGLVVSFNGATSLILGYEFCSQGCHELARHFNQFPNLPLRPLELTSTFKKLVAVRVPLGPHFHDYFVFMRLADGWLPSPRFVVTQHGPTTH
jgi:hypothetical protein